MTQTIRSDDSPTELLAPVRVIEPGQRILY